MTIAELRGRSDAFVVIADQDGVITFVHDAFKEVLGWRADDLLDKPITAIIPRNFRDAHHLGFSRFLLTGKATLLNRILKLKVLTKDGKELDSEHFIIGEQDSGQWIFGALIRPLVSP